MRYLALIFVLLMCTSCPGKMPPITVCSYDQPLQVFHCVDAQNKAFDLPAADEKADKMVAIPLNDFGVLMDYVRLKCRSR